MAKNSVQAILAAAICFAAAKIASTLMVLPTTACLFNICMYMVDGAVV